MFPFAEEEKENLEQERPDDQKNEKIIANLNDITGHNQDMETPTPNPDDMKPSPVRQEEKEKAKEEIIQKIENEANKAPINSKVADPNIKRKLEGDFDSNDNNSKKGNDTNSKKGGADTNSKKGVPVGDNASKKDKKPIMETPTPNQEEDKIPLVAKDQPQQQPPPQNSAPVKEKEKEKELEPEKVELQASAPSGNNLGISLRIPEKEKNDKKGKEECKKKF